MTDLRFAFRQLLKNTAFAFVAILSLAIGIGANTVVFTWIRATLLDAIPLASDPGRLVVLAPYHKSAGINDTMSLADIESMKLESNVFSGIIASQYGVTSVRLGTTVEWLWGQNTTANFFGVLGVKPVLGRGFIAGEDRPGAKDRVAVISQSLWQQRFGGSPEVLGKVIEIDRRPVTIVGVAPAGFNGTMGGLRFDVWVPLATQMESADLEQRYTSRSWRWLHTIARLAPGVSLRDARAAADTVGRHLAGDFPDVSRDTTISVLRLWESPWGGQSLFLPLLRALTVVASLLLLLVVANVANLLLVRAHAREREMSVRLAVGATAGRVIRQLLCENLLLAAIGGAAGIALAMAGARLLLDLMPTTYLPVDYYFGWSWGVLAATGFVTLASGLLFGLAPALNAARTDLNQALKSGSGAVSGVGPRQRLRRALVIGEVALALVLLLGMGLCVRSFAQARQIDLGLDPRRIWVAGFRMSPSRVTDGSARDFYRKLRQQAATLPGVEAVGMADWFPLGFEGGSTTRVRVPGYEPSPGESLGVGISIVSPGYFDALRIPILAGRQFMEADDREVPLVGVVNEAFARRFLSGRDPLGLIFNTGRGEARIVGVVKTGKYQSLNEPVTAYVYLSAGQVDSRDLGLAVRTRGDPRHVANEIRRLAAAIDSDVTPHAAMTYEEYVAAAFTVPRVAATLLTALGVLALLLAVLGIYAVVSQNVNQRTREFGVRLALGARRSDVLKLVLTQGIVLAVLGILLGAAAGFGAGRALETLLVGMSARDPVTWVLVPALLFVAAFAACWLPARRAAKVDPMRALRCE